MKVVYLIWGSCLLLPFQSARAEDLPVSPDSMIQTYQKAFQAQVDVNSLLQSNDGNLALRKASCPSPSAFGINVRRVNAKLSDVEKNLAQKKDVFDALS